MAMGVSYETFWHLTPHKLKAFAKAYELQRKLKDEEMWIMGRYVLSAVSTAVEHCLAGKKAKSQYLSAPIFKEFVEEDGLSLEERERKVIERMIAQEDLCIRRLREKGLPETEMS